MYNDPPSHYFCSLFSLHFLLLSLFTCHTAPGASPQNIRALPLSSTSFSITWEEVPEDQKNGIIRRYDVVVSSQAGEVLQNIFLSESRRSVNVTNLEEHTIYRCRVRARTVAPGPYSTEIQVQTPEDSKSHTIMFLLPALHTCVTN